MTKAKRVILRLRANDFNDFNHADHVKPVESYLIFSGRSTQELVENRHYVHVEPLNPEITKSNPRFHIIIDIEKDHFQGTLDQNFPHELYRVRRENDDL